MPLLLQEDQKEKMKKNHELRVRLDASEYEKLKRKAEGLGISLSDFVRMIILSAEIEIKIR